MIFRPMIVIKLGGSLTASTALTNCFNKINNHYSNKQVIVVPGGGAFADQVRSAQQQWLFDDLTAHHMAILAMQQMALLFKALQPDWRLFSSAAEIKNAKQSVLIWSPLPSELDDAGVEAGWNITSDSLAAWIAKQTGATELILVKSADIAPKSTIQDLQHQGVIDTAFHTFIPSPGFTISIKNHHKF